MIKLEIIINEAIEEDVMEELTLQGYGENFTYVYPVFGRGQHGRREGSAIWPEENVLLILVIEDNKLEPLVEGLRKIKAQFSKEGFRCYIQRNVERVI